MIDECLNEILNGGQITSIDNKQKRMYVHLVAKSLGYVSKTVKEHESEDVCQKHYDTYYCGRSCRKKYRIYTEHNYVPISMDVNSRCMFQNKYVTEKLLNTCMYFPKEINSHIVEFLI
jgi:hypothetical protein